MHKKPDYLVFVCVYMFVYICMNMHVCDKSQVHHACSSHCTIETLDRTDRIEFIPSVPLCHGTLGTGNVCSHFIPIYDQY